MYIINNIIHVFSKIMVNNYGLLKEVVNNKDKLFINKF